jgi:hypothetical protein
MRCSKNMRNGVATLATLARTHSRSRQRFGLIGIRSADLGRCANLAGSQLLATAYDSVIRWRKQFRARWVDGVEHGTNRQIARQLTPHRLRKASRLVFVQFACAEGNAQSGQ